LKVKCIGDVKVDYHHSVEDVGIVLGQCIKGALGDKKGIERYGSMTLPMDEALILCALDMSGRSTLRYTLEPPSQRVGDFDIELVEEFFLGLCREACMTLHLKKLDGTNTHHIIEGAFKAFGKAMRQAVSIDEDFADEIPSTKGVL
jgi:imidazoleglycerol-phosphate dehydratase